MRHQSQGTELGPGEGEVPFRRGVSAEVLGRAQAGGRAWTCGSPHAAGGAVGGLGVLVGATCAEQAAGVAGPSGCYNSVSKPNDFLESDFFAQENYAVPFLRNTVKYCILNHFCSGLGLAPLSGCLRTGRGAAFLPRGHEAFQRQVSSSLLSGDMLGTVWQSGRPPLTPDSLLRFHIRPGGDAFMYLEMVVAFLASCF